jgi:serine protease
MKYYLPILLFMCSVLNGNAQEASNTYVSGEIILQLAKPNAIAQMAKDLETINGKKSDIKIIHELSDVAHIWHIRYNSQSISDQEMLLAVKLNKNVREAQFNHYVALRSTVPNDPQYNQQWQYDNNGSNGGTPDADIDAPEAWDITTGGITADGDTIVVAIIDDGINLAHPDLQGNLWKNYAEIPGNGMDDDGNGYIDDVDGWNAQNNNGTITGGSHGTPVAGIIGAKGNNGIGVSGVNWDVKLMIIRGSSGNEAMVIAAYGYALKMRKLYNQTNGVQGAFVVATNSSFGVNNGNPANYPLWCAMYDSMGVAGILSAGATINGNTNVDVAGDIPTACSSDYLISVTNVGRNDNKVTQAGYGATTIDMGSFGEATYTLTQTAYGGFGGTSGATPHVTGTAALIYSVPCPEFIQFAKSDPAAATLQVKEWIMESGDVNASLAGITVTGKRLNTFNAVSEVVNNCGSCPLPGGVSSSNLKVDSATVSWNISSAATQYLLQYRAVGTNTWLEQTSSTSPVNLGGLIPCTNYQYRLKSICDTDSSSGYTNIRTFKTDGCCEAPLSTSLSGLTENNVQINWPVVTAAVAYNFRYREEGSNTWINVNNITNPAQTLNGLGSCTRYEYQIATACIAGMTEYGALYTFKTKGCGACEELNYCQSFAVSDYLFIDKIQIGNIDNTSGDNQGYGEFISTGYAWIMADSASNITLTPAFPSFPITANWNVWVDWNQNGVFESSEMVITASGSGALTRTITPPASADTGITRMRIAVAGLQTPVECGDGGYGEVEDYCVRIKPRSFAGINEASVSSSIIIFPNPANNIINIQIGDEKYNKAELMDISGKTIQSISLQNHTELILMDIENISNGIYLIRLSGNQNSVTKKVVIKK